MKSLPSVHKKGCKTEVGERITFSMRGGKCSKNSRSQIEGINKLQLCIAQTVPLPIIDEARRSPKSEF